MAFIVVRRDATGGGHPPPTVRVGTEPPLRRQAQRIADIVAQTPGLNIDEIAARLGLRRTAANHHLRILLRSGILVRIRQGRHVLHFPVRTSPAQRRAICVLRVPGMRAIARDLFEHPTDLCSARARRIGVSDRHVRRGLNSLAKQDLAHIEQVPRQPPTVHLHPDLRLILARTPPAPDGAWPPDLP